MGIGKADSDDEQIPDPPAFTSKVNLDYRRLKHSFESALSCEFQNAAGKLFFMSLGNFVLHVQSTDHYSS